MAIDKVDLMFGYPVKLDENTFIYQPLLKDVIKDKIVLENVVEPFISLDKRLLEDVDVARSNLGILFEDMFVNFNAIKKMSNDESLDFEQFMFSPLGNLVALKRLLGSLQWLCRTNNIKLNIHDTIETGEIIINDTFTINRDNYEDIRSDIVKILDVDISDLKPKPKLSEFEQEMEKRFAVAEAEYRKQHNKKESAPIDIYTYVEYIVNYRYSKYNYNSIQDLTVYQIKNTFRYIQRQEASETDLSFRSSGNFEMKDKPKHWFFKD